MSEAERQYDLVHNEGGEGYNPHRAARERAEFDAARNEPLTLDDLRRRLERLDNSLARESGTFDQTKVDALRAQIAAMEAEQDAAFLAAWPRELTMERRAAWNAWVRSATTPKGVPVSAIAAQERAQGWVPSDLRRAIKLHGLA
jgi:hypothetical protein